MAAASDMSAAVDVSADSAGDTSMDKEKDDILNYNFIVALRVRPLLSRELQQEAQSIIKLLDNRVVCVLDPEKLKIGGQEDYLRRDRNRERQFTYDIAFDETATQQDVFEHTGKHLVEGVLQGFNSSVFAYGATGAGKTYTMLGDMKNPGLMVRTVAALFERINEQKEFKFTTHMSYLEVYNENIKDLLTPSSQNLELREDAERGVTVAGITEYATSGVEETMELLHRGNQNRAVEPTKRNETSSRSHAVLQIVIDKEMKSAAIHKTILIGKLSLIDLAGSERASSTENRGQRLLEGANINRSLLALANCINALAGDAGKKGKRSSLAPAKYVPYRDSKLTRILKDSFGGNTRTAMIANINSSHLEIEETLNTLKYANRAKNIKTKLKRNVKDVESHVSDYKRIIEDLRQEVADLKDKIRSKGINNAPQVPPRFELPVEFGNARLQAPDHAATAAAAAAAAAAADKFLREIEHKLESRMELMSRLVESEEALWLAELASWQEGSTTSPRDLSASSGGTTQADRCRQLCAGVRDKLQANEADFRHLQQELRSRAIPASKKAQVALVVKNRVLAMQNQELQQRTGAKQRFVNRALHAVAQSPALAVQLIKFAEADKSSGAAGVDIFSEDLLSTLTPKWVESPLSSSLRTSSINVPAISGGGLEKQMFKSRAPSRLYPAASNSNTGNPQRQQYAAIPSNTFNNVSPAKMKMLKPRPPLHPAPERPVSAPHSPPSGQGNGDAAGGTVAPFSDPPGSTKIPSVHTQMRMHMRLNAGEAMGVGAPDRFNSQPPPKVQRSGISVLNGQPAPGRRDAPDRFAMYDDSVLANVRRLQAAYGAPVARKGKAKLK